MKMVIQPAARPLSGILMDTAVYSLLSIVVLGLLFARCSRKGSKLPYPPGPERLPIVGNLLNFPTKKAWLVFTKWKKEYGDIVYTNVLGKPTVILNSRRICEELLDKRSAIYSNRPRVVMLNEVMGFHWSFAFMPYSAEWRQHRRLFHQHFSANASKKYTPIQERGVRAFLVRLQSNPSGFMEHIRLLFADNVLDTVYGFRTESSHNDHVQRLEKILQALSEASIPGRYWVDLLPALKYVPSWLPGAEFQREGIRAKQLAAEAKDLLAKHAQELEAPTMFTTMLEQCKEEGICQQFGDSPLDFAKSNAGGAYIAGADSTISSIQGFFLAMANYPDVQQAAQAEIDAVVGNNRLPTFNDMHDLPYICAVVKETQRWHSVAPSGIAHQLTEDDVYEGYLIPKGAVVLANAWAMLHDPDVYPDPERFNPSRWLTNTPGGVKLNNTVPSPDIAFGFGRRICPGQHFAQNSLFITVSNVLACFNISPLDESGKPCECIPERFTDGVLVYPEPYNASISPRSEKILGLLQEADL